MAIVSNNLVIHLHRLESKSDSSPIVSAEISRYTSQLILSVGLSLALDQCEHAIIVLNYCITQKKV